MFLANSTLESRTRRVDKSAGESNLRPSTISMRAICFSVPLLSTKNVHDINSFVKNFARRSPPHHHNAPSVRHRTKIKKKYQLQSKTVIKNDRCIRVSRAHTHTRRRRRRGNRTRYQTQRFTGMSVIRCTLCERVKRLRGKKTKAYTGGREPPVSQTKGDGRSPAAARVASRIKKNKK